MTSPGGFHTVEYDAHRSPVDSVTVFQTDRAEVKRKIKIELKDGQNEVEVKNLPTCLEESSIRVDGIGNATIFDVVYHPPPPFDQKKYVESLEELNAQKEKITDEIAIFKRQGEVLKDYAKTLKGSDTDSAKLETFLDVFAARQRKINEARTKLYEDLKLVEKAITERSISLNADEESVRQRGVRVTIVVLADGEGEAELFLTYVVSNAWWTPQYDLRASIAQDTKSESQVSLHYRAAIVQKTGEDWTNVALTLSTASPLQGTNIPALNPQWISERPKPPKPAPVEVDFGHRVRYFRRVRQHSQEEEHYRRSRSPLPVIVHTSSRRSRSRSRSRSPMRQPTVIINAPAAQVPPPDFFRARDSAAADGAVSATFTIPGLSSIPSDSDKQQQTHKVSIAELRFETVDLEWITVPKDIPSTFLRCRVQNTTKYVLLAGQANVFLNASFVAKSTIPHVSPQESFSCSLGVDPAVRVTYHPQLKKIKTTGVSVLSTKTTTHAFEQTITLKNTRLSRLPRLIVKDQIPVSRNSHIKVNLLEPKIVGSAKGKAAAVADNVQARWVQRNEDDVSALKTADELNAENAQGLVEWVCELAPGATVDIKLAWEISASSDVDWVNQ